MMQIWVKKIYTNMCKVQGLSLERIESWNLGLLEAETRARRNLRCLYISVDNEILQCTGT